jgi:hypothetical protein
MEYGNNWREVYPLVVLSATGQSFSAFSALLQKEVGLFIGCFRCLLNVGCNIVYYWSNQC